MQPRVLIAMSGGVDSSVAAFLLKEQGFLCCGARMKLFDTEENAMFCEKSCCHAADSDDARSVAFRLGIPFYVFNWTQLFQETVIERFIRLYRNCQTPNPCIDCNRFLKFDRFLRRADELNYDFIATGHYARIEYKETAGRYLLKRAIDETKDQSYVLYAMTQEQLARSKFPLGNYYKSEIRDIAQQHGFENAAKHESQDICFVPYGDYGAFIERQTGQTFSEGDFIDVQTGKVLGKHRGLIRYTIGQRKGLGIADKTPYYVCGFGTEENSVLLCKIKDLYSVSLEAADINLIQYSKIERPLKVTAKIRYRQTAKPAMVEQIGGDRIRVVFDEPQKAITPGQAVVLYDGDSVIGGGTILTPNSNS